MEEALESGARAGSLIEALVTLTLSLSRVHVRHTLSCGKKGSLLPQGGSWEHQSLEFWAWKKGFSWGLESRVGMKLQGA